MLIHLLGCLVKSLICHCVSLGKEAHILFGLKKNLSNRQLLQTCFVRDPCNTFRIKMYFITLVFICRDIPEYMENTVCVLDC